MARYAVQGLTFWFETVDASPVTQIAQISDININKQAAAEIDATGLDDLSSVTLAGLPQSSTLTLVLFFDPALTGHTTIMSLEGTNTVRDFEIRMATSPPKKFTGTAVVSLATPVFGRGNAITLSVEFKLTSALTLV